MSKLAVVILAAGEGTRMKSSLSKVLHLLAGKPLVRWVLSAVAETRPSVVTLVVGHKREQVMEALRGEKVSFVFQKDQRGSGHALIQAGQKLKNFTGDILVLCGDTPLIKGDTLRKLIQFHRSRRNDATVLSAAFDDPFGYGRIVRFSDGRVQGIVEEKDATPEQRAIKEINSGIYCFKSPLLWQALKKIKAGNAKKEYYLTDVISILNGMKKKTGACDAVSAEEIMGVNSRVDLAAAEGAARGRIVDALMRGGITVIDPRTTYVGPDVRIGQDTVLYPGTIIEGRTDIGAGCVIGPSSFIRDSHVGDNTEIRSSYMTLAEVGNGVRIGPFAHIRPESVLRDRVRVGNFSEVKKSIINTGSKVNHLSYIGDAELGVDVNVGAGTITCNYDGLHKNKTMIGDRVFVGSNVNFVAPVSVGNDVLIAAGSTITHNVPENMLAIARERQTVRPKKKHAAK